MSRYEILYIPSGTYLHFYIPSHNHDMETPVQQCELVIASNWFKDTKNKDLTKLDALKVLNNFLTLNGTGDDRWRAFHSISLPAHIEDFEIIEINDE